MAVKVSVASAAADEALGDKEEEEEEEKDDDEEFSAPRAELVELDSFSSCSTPPPVYFLY